MLFYVNYVRNAFIVIQYQQSEFRLSNFAWRTESSSSKSNNYLQALLRYANVLSLCLHCACMRTGILAHRDVDKVHDIMDDIAEANELHEEISEVISAPTGFGQDVDEVS